MWDDDLRSGFFLALEPLRESPFGEFLGLRESLLGVTLMRGLIVVGAPLPFSLGGVRLRSGILAPKSQS